ncbi:MAG TPA: MFS transporter [Candidatus Limnocylindrales bacterium]|nr:MFS transporter [Candidatus Limnocylindrales bacterium]
MRLLPTRLIETVAPTRLGRSFRYLLAANSIDNAGDGIVIAAGPLLVASLTHEAFLVSLALFAETSPFLVFGLFGGVAADRFDRRGMVIAANVARFALFSFLVATIVTGIVTIWLVLVVLFAIGTAEVMADSASSTLMPSLVDRADLGVANARASASMLLTNQLLFPPVGAFLFALDRSVPFATNAVCVLAAAILMTRVITPVRERRTERSSIRSDLVEGIRWLIAHPPMRTLTLTILTFNVTYGAAWSVLVLYATRRLGMDEIGFGLLTTAIAVGGVIGTAVYGRLERRFHLGDIMRVGLVIETVTHLVLALTTSPVVALGMLVIFGAHAFVWGTTSTVVRQRSVPDEVLGRVGGVYRVAIQGGIVIGTPIGGLIASAFGITGPFWFAFAGSALLVAVLWRQFPLIAHDAEV